MAEFHNQIQAATQQSRDAKGIADRAKMVQVTPGVISSDMKPQSDTGQDSLYGGSKHSIPNSALQVRVHAGGNDTGLGSTMTKIGENIATNQSSKPTSIKGAASIIAEEQNVNNHMNSTGQYDRLPQTGHGSSGENFARQDGTIQCGTNQD